MPILVPTVAALDEAAGRLLAGDTIGLPTETVYGLAADAASAQGVAAIYRIKSRPADHPLIVHVADLEQAGWWAELDERARRLGKAFWPGPLTLILPRRAGAPAHACGAEASIGIRVPSHPVALALLARFTAKGGHGLAAPSANLFGRVSPTCARHVQDDLGDAVAMVLDGGDCDVGVESTIVDLTRSEAVLLRPGGLSQPAIEAALGAPLRARDAQAPRAPGTLEAHYAPGTPLELVDTAHLAARAGALKALGLKTVTWSRRPPSSGLWRESPADAAAYAHVLYDSLRLLDSLAADRILIETPPAGSDWVAVHDRLGRAAATFHESRP